MMKLAPKKKVIVQVYPGRQFGTMIGSNNGLIGILLDNGEYIDVPLERVRIILEEDEPDEEKGYKPSGAADGLPQFY